MVDLCGVQLRGPVLNGSGTYDAIAARRTFGDELLERFPFDCFVSKTITIAPRQGNPPPRLWETPAGLINSIGLPNKGLDGFLAEDLPKLAELPVPLCVSVMGFDHDELRKLVTEVGARDEVALIELNFSCPNVETGLIMGADPSETASAVDALRPLTGKPLIVKLTPNATDPAAVATAAEAAGADAVSLINTLKGMALHPRTREPWLGGITGGVSGAAVRAVALEQVHSVSRAVRIPVDRHGRHRQRPRRRRFPQRWAQHVSRWAPRASATPPPAPGSRPSWTSFLAKSGSFPPGAVRYAHNRS